MGDNVAYCVKCDLICAAFISSVMLRITLGYRAWRHQCDLISVKLEVKVYGFGKVTCFYK